MAKDILEAGNEQEQREIEVVSIPKLTRSGKWILYDWANSAFALTVLAAFFPLLFRTQWSFMNEGSTTVRLGIANGIIGLFVAIVSPLLASLSSMSGHRKSYLIFWGTISMLATAGLAFVPNGEWLIALSLFGIARIGFQFSNLFYDSMLVDVSSAKRYHRVSTLGFAFGYIGGAALFLVNVVISMNWEFLGFSSEVQTQRLAIFSVALWWFLFAIPLWKMKINSGNSISVNSFRRIKVMFSRSLQTAQFVMSNKNIFKFLLAYWFYIDGVHTVVLMATNFGLALGFTSKSLLIALFVVQLIAFPSSIIAGFLADKFRAKPVIAFSILVYIIVTGVGGITMSEPHHFTWFAIATGMVQGGIQALSRSLYQTIIPREKSTELFGIYNMVGRFAMILGPVLFAIAQAVVNRFPSLGNGEAVRVGMSSLSILFIIGLFLLFRVHEPRRRDLTVER